TGGKEASEVAAAEEGVGMEDAVMAELCGEKLKVIFSIVEMIPPKRAKFSEGISFSQIESSPLEVNQSSPSPIEKLPRELAFAIFEYVPECVENLRMASTALLNRVNEFALQRTTIQLVDELLFETDNEHRIRATLAMPRKTEYLFELRYQLRRGSIAKSRVKRNRQDQLTDSGLYAFALSKREHKLWECISAAIGIRICGISITSCYEKITLDTMTSLLEAFKFKNLGVQCPALFATCGCSPEISSQVVDALLDVIAAKKIDHLQMSLNLDYNIAFKEYMLKISSLVRSLHLDPVWNFVRTRTETPHIILGMLSRKVDKLLIEDHHFRDFTYSFSQEMIVFLAKHIPQLGKVIWFQASCPQNATVISSYDNYQIEVVKRPPIDTNDWSYKNQPAYYVDIKHISRVGEPPMKKLMTIKKPNS
ncbi:hypothetical protein PRIPAC_86499, partial [Pristionchus pacificus]|uniref:Uncharacterized protein n=1 Tax=Pristionchus pacificus TaxID=54126 RepID=A0A2A6BKF8_PRIPA